MSPRDEKKRLDVLMWETGMASSRQRAAALIMAGQVLVNGLRVEKPGKEVSPSADLTVKQSLPFVSRGGLKLEAALATFHVTPAGLSFLDAGASTGGFTHCLLERGARRVIALDVGYGQLDWSLRTDDRVIVLERTNVRYLTPEMLSHPVDAAVADLSFISLKLVLRPLRAVLPNEGWLIVLVKPQFEVGREHISKGGVVRDTQKILECLDAVKSEARNSGFIPLAQEESPVRGPKGNREFFLHLGCVASS